MELSATLRMEKRCGEGCGHGWISVSLQLLFTGPTVAWWSSNGAMVNWVVILFFTLGLAGFKANTQCLLVISGVDDESKGDN